MSFSNFTKEKRNYFLKIIRPKIPLSFPKFVMLRYISMILMHSTDHQPITGQPMQRKWFSMFCMHAWLLKHPNSIVCPFPITRNWYNHSHFFKALKTNASYVIFGYLPRVDKVGTNRFINNLFNTNRHAHSLHECSFK